MFLFVVQKVLCTGGSQWETGSEHLIYSRKHFLTILHSNGEKTSIKPIEYFQLLQESYFLREARQSKREEADDWRVLNDAVWEQEVQVIIC